MTRREPSLRRATGPTRLPFASAGNRLCAGSAGPSLLSGVKPLQCYIPGRETVPRAEPQRLAIEQVIRLTEQDDLRERQRVLQAEAKDAENWRPSSSGSAATRPP